MNSPENAQPAVVGNTIFPFGPGIHAAFISEEDRNTILEHANSKQRDDASMGLVGNIEREVWCSEEFSQTVLTPMLAPFVQRYLNELSAAGRIGPSTPIAYNAARVNQGSDGDGAEIHTELRLVNAWVNFTSPGPDFNPPHIHNCDLSSILYLDVPTEMSTIFPESETPWRNNGKTTFLSGSPQPFAINEFVVGDPSPGRFLIFPANLTHWVMPYYNKQGEKRITLSANFMLDQNVTSPPWQRKYDWEAPLPK